MKEVHKSKEQRASFCTSNNSEPMARSAIPLLLLMLLLLSSSLPEYTVAQIRSMCLSQFALANQACAILPTDEAPNDLDQTKFQLASDGDGDDDDGDDDAEDNEHRRRQGSGNNHGQREGGNRNGHRRRHRNGNGHRQRHGSEANRYCCRWLNEVDSSCVCTALLRLPPFLSKPKHEYWVKVGNSCTRTFSCGGA